jgi:hypothetical protein
MTKNAGMAERRALGARTAGYVCPNAKPPRIVRISGPPSGNLPTTLTIRECPACGEPETAELYGWHLPLSAANLAGCELDYATDIEPG